MSTQSLDGGAIWAEQMFGSCRLGDERLDRRLVQYVASQSRAPTASTSKACEGSKAEREGAYRLLENPRVKAEDIDIGPYQHCAAACEGTRRVLAIQDTTSVKVHHQALAESVQEAGGPTGFVVHSLIMVCADTGLPLGIADQQRWIREKNRPRTDQRRQRDYRGKESFKWQQAVESGYARLPEMDQVISVCDREADVYEFLAYHLEHDLDFVVRASWNRRIDEEVGHVFEAARQAPVVGERQIRIEQRGAQRGGGSQSKRAGRPRRDVTTQLQATATCLRPPRNRKTEVTGSLNVNVVRVSEVDPPDGAESLEWILLTTLPIDDPRAVEQIVRDYERRWLIEEFFKCWKTGCRVETRPFQTFEAVERMLAITSAIGIRILQLQMASREPDADQKPAPLDENEWRCLWMAICDDPFPEHKPSAQWAYRALAKLGGWYDTKGTGRAGWKTLWDGWSSLQQRLSGWLAAQRAAKM